MCWVNVSHKRNGLGEVDVNGLIPRQVLIIFVLDHDGAVLNTSTATRAFFFLNVSGFLDQGHIELTRFSFHPVNFGIGKDLDIGMPADLDQFRRKYSDRAVVGWKGLVQLGHFAANGRRFVNQVNLEPGGGKIQGGLDTADSSADHHYISDTIPKLFFNSFLRHFSCLYNFQILNSKF